MGFASLRDEHYVVLAKHLNLHPENGIMLHGRSLVIFCAVYILSLAQPRRALNVRQAEYAVKKSRSRHRLVGDKILRRLVVRM